MMPSVPAVTSVLPSRLRLKPITPGFGFLGMGGDGLQRKTACARHEVKLSSRTATQLKLKPSRSIRLSLSLLLSFIQERCRTTSHAADRRRKYGFGQYYTARLIRPSY